MRRSILSLLAFLLVSIPASASITGAVINTDGQPVAGAKVSIFTPETFEARRIRLTSASPQRTPLATASTDSKGTFKIDAPKDQPVVDLRVEAAGLAPDAMAVTPDEDLGGIAMITAPMMRGTITAAGKPLPGATVIWSSATAQMIATTDADGHYSVPDPSKWALRLVIIHPDYAVLSETGGFASPIKGVDRSLSAGVSLSGKVVGEDGQTPVAKATLWIDQWPAGTTADNGTFTIAHAPSDWKQIEAHSGNLIGMRARSGNTAPAIRLAKAARLTGSVRDTKNQLPIAGAEIRLVPLAPGFFATTVGESTVTDAKGSFALLSLPGQFTLVASHPGNNIQNSTISLTAGQSVNKTLYGNPRARVSGSVMDDDKRAVTGARLSARRAGGAGPGGFFPAINREPELPAYSAPDGHFVLRNVPAEAEVQIEATKKGFPTGRAPSAVRVSAGERKSGVIVTIPRGVAFTGRVIDANGKPVSGVAVEAGETSGGPMGIRRMILTAMRQRPDDQVRTASDGTFTIRLREGSYDVSFQREGYASKTLRAQTVNATSKPVEVKLEPGVVISGRVQRAGVGVEGVMVNAISMEGNASATTASDGSFTLSDLTPGQMMLAINKQDAFIEQVRPVTAPAHDVLFNLPAGGTIKGRVLDKSTHSPVTSFQAGISTSRGGGGFVVMTPPMMKSFTSDDGTFTLENLPPGPTQLIVSAPGFTTAHVPGVNVEDGKTVSDLEVDLDTGVKLTGRVTSSEGTPLAGVSVRLDPSGGNNARVMRLDPNEVTAVTDPNGEYTMDAVDSGEKTFTFQRQGYLTEQRTVTLSGREGRLDVQLSSGVRLTGTVTTDAGVPVADAAVNAMSASDAAFGRRANTDANGNFVLDGLAPGHYTLTASKTGLANGIVRDFDVAAGAPARITMKSGGTIMGHVTGLSADELQSALVMVNSPNGNAQGEVDSSGNYRIEGAPTGTVRVSAQTGRAFGAGRKTSPVKSAQVDAGSAVQVDLEFKSGTVINGRVTRDGQPLANAVVAFVPRSAQAQTQSTGTTDSSGLYQVSGLEDGAYNVQVIDVDRSTPFHATYDVHGSSNFDIDMKTASVRGRVLDASTGEPIADAQVEIHAGGGTDSIFSSRIAATDPSGNFVFEHVPRGSYQAKAEKSGYGHDLRNLVVGDSDPDALEFKISQSSGVTLNVVDARDNRALSANVVKLVDGQGNDLETPSFRFNASPEPLKLTLAPGTYRATITAMGYAPQTVAVVSPSNQTVRMSPGGTVVLRSKSSALRVRLLDSSGAAFPRGPNGIFNIDPKPLSTTLNNVAPGTYQLQVLGGGDQIVNTIPVTVVEGQQTVVDV